MAPIMRYILLLLYLPLSIAAAVNAPEQNVEHQKRSPEDTHRKTSAEKKQPQNEQGRKVPTPDEDEFYLAPPGFEDQPPGTVLKTRKIESTFLGLAPSGVETWQLLFRTNVIGGSLNHPRGGVPDVSVTTVFVPVGALTDRFVSFHTHYDFAAKICNPSYTYQLGAEQTDLITNEEFTTIEAFLISKYIVASPDYQGRESAFGAGLIAGWTTLDSMRAVANFGQTLGLTTDVPAIVGYGYSGGSLASAWAAELQRSYAPELNIKGWSMGGIPVSIRNVANYIDRTVYSGFTPAAIAGLNKPSAYGRSLQNVIASIVTPYGQSVLDYADTHCLSTLFNFFEKSIFDTSVQRLGKNLFQQPTISRVLDENVLGRGTPIAPLYVYNAEKDEIAPYDDVTFLVENWCDRGVAINYVTLGGGGHLTTESLAFTGAFKFIQAAFAESVPPRGCTQSITNDDRIDPAALGTDLEPVLFRLIDILNALGSRDGKVNRNLSMLNSQAKPQKGS